VFDGVPSFDVSASELQNGIGVIDLLAEKTSIFPSKGEARKMIQAGGVSMNKHKIEDVQMMVNHTNAINNKYILIQKGKKKGDVGGRKTFRMFLLLDCGRCN
jgi:tyrosyl-tRNA synthetase